MILPTECSVRALLDRRSDLRKMLDTMPICGSVMGDGRWEKEVDVPARTVRPVDMARKV